MCSHIAFVELDGQMAFKQALAWAVTGDAAYAATALGIVDRWASRNVEWGICAENGPLEAGAQLHCWFESARWTWRHGTRDCTAARMLACSHARAPTATACKHVNPACPGARL